MLLQWPQQGVNGLLLCPVVQDSLTRFYLGIPNICSVGVPFSGEEKILIIVFFLEMNNFRLWNWIFCIQVKAFIEGGIMVSASPQLQQLGIRQLLSLVFQGEKWQTKLRRRFELLLFLVHT